MAGAVTVLLAAAGLAGCRSAVPTWHAHRRVARLGAGRAGGGASARSIALAGRALDRLRRHGAARRHEAAVPEALEAVARGLRSGASLRLAIAEAAGSGPPDVAAELAAIVAAADRGVPLADAAEGWPRRRPLPAVRVAAVALAVAAEAGGGAARAVDGAAATVRADLAVAAETRALTSQARYSALVIASAPVAFAALGVLGDARHLQVLLYTPLGRVCLAAALVLDLVGLWWMHRLTAP